MSNLIESMINENQKFSKDMEKKSKKRVNESHAPLSYYPSIDEMVEYLRSISSTDKYYITVYLPDGAYRYKDYYTLDEVKKCIEDNYDGEAVWTDVTGIRFTKDAPVRKGFVISSTETAKDSLLKIGKTSESKSRRRVKEDYDYDEFTRIYKELPPDVQERMDSGWSSPYGNFMSSRKTLLAYLTALFDVGLITKADIDLMDQMNKEEDNYLSESKERVNEATNDNYEVYIIVENGRVQDVFSTTARLNVSVLDFDTTDPDEKEEINQQYEEINQRVAGGELKYVW